MISSRYLWSRTCPRIIRHHVFYTTKAATASATVTATSTATTPASTLPPPPRLQNKSTTWHQAVQQAQRLVDDEPVIDPIALVGPDWGNIGKLLSSQHPFVNTVAQHYFSGQGKHIRPLLVLLMAQATSVTTSTPPSRPPHVAIDFQSIDQPISYGLLNMTPASLFNHQQHYTPNCTRGGCTVLPTQRRLAEITEMIHTASLLHDNVIYAH
ncbi:unnamed protein product [Absidia cylindrospora]